MAKGNFTTDELTNYYAKIYAEVEDSTVNDPYGNYILQRVKGGQKSVFNKTQSEILICHSWILLNLYIQLF